MMHSKKGFFFTMDALMAILVIAFLLSTFYFSPYVPALGSEERIKFLHSVGLYLERSGDLARSVNDPTPAIYLLFSLPSDMCVSLTLYNQSGSPLWTAAPFNCTAYTWSGMFYQTMEDLVLPNGSVYYAVLRVDGVRE